MEAIKTYLDNVFAAFPQTERVTVLKRDMLEGMEEKYHELKREGKSEHEAIGSVISNFGNIDEIAAELGVEQNNAEPEDEPEDFISLSHEEAYDYLAQTKKCAMCIGLGVWLIMAGICALIMITSPPDSNGDTSGNIIDSIGGIFESIFETDDAADNTSSAIGVLALLATIAIAVPIFIVSGVRLSRFEDYEERFIKLDTHTRAELEEQRTRYTTRFAVLISTGVGFILLAVGTLIFLSSLGYSILPVIILLFTIGFSVFLFITAAMRYSAYDVLLGKGDYRHKLSLSKLELKKVERIIGTIAAAYWPLAVAIYLLVSFLSGAWHISWVIWPVAGVLFGAIAGGVGAWYGTKVK